MSSSNNNGINYKYATLDDGSKIFYREAGDRETKPTLLLLHGFPSSSFQFRHLIQQLKDHFYIVAPDIPSFGHTQVPSNYVYTFDNFANTITKFVDQLNLKKYAIYVFDYGCPVGLRLCIKYPERVNGFISQNGNAYLEGLGDAWAPVRALWAENSESNRKVIRDNLLTLEGTKWQYTEGARDESLIAPESYHFDYYLLERPGMKEIQLDIFYDYQNNLKLYPNFQEFFRNNKVKTLVIWGDGDKFFIPAGAHAFKKDNPDAIVELLPTSHFALETHGEYIGKRIIETFSN